MCGIAGIFAYGSRSPRPELSELRYIRDHMERRGPDSAGEWVSTEGQIALGHRRLSIIDLSDRASQPMQSADGRFAIVFNGEIYNYRALRDELITQGCSFRTQSDTEVLLHLYATRGREMVRQLRGMFAFAIWDNDRRGLFLARDPYGIKPLYYSDDGRSFRFASQVRALLAGDRVSPEADPAGWLGFYYFGSVPEPFTTYRQIRALPAGSVMWVGRGVGKPESYANITQVMIEAEELPRPHSQAEAFEVIRSTLVDSVRAHLVADVQIGLFLSAGIDSGSLMGLMRDAGQSAIHAVTLSYGEYRGTSADEAPLAAKTAELYGCNHTVRTVTESEFRQDLPHILDAMDQPSIDGINTWFVSKAARELGLKAALSGLGGDELFGGYPSFRDIPRLVSAHRMFPGLWWLGDAARRAVRPFLWHANPKVAGIIKYGATYPGAYFLLRGLFMPWEMGPIIHAPDVLAEATQRLEPIDLMTQVLRPSPREAFSNVAALEASLYLRNQLLRDTDWASMAHSLEVRTPFVDYALLKAIWPSILALSKGAGKQLLATVPKQSLPADVVLRTKTGFGTPVDQWLQRDSRLQDWRRVRVLANPNCGWARRWAYQLAAVGRSVPKSAFIPRTDRVPSRNSVIIFRIGSIGDTVCALPCFHRIAEKFTSYNRILLTDIPSKMKGAPVESILGNSGLIHDVLYFPANNRTVVDLLAIRRQIQRTEAKVLVYVADRPLYSSIRDILFFKLCGIQTIIGAPLHRDLRFPRMDIITGEQESETVRLTRCLTALGEFDLDNRAAWDLRLQQDEIADAERALRPLAGRSFIAINLGGKVAQKDWGEGNWNVLLDTLSESHGHLGLVFIGSADEWERCERTALRWKGTVLNLCGSLTPRQSAAVLRSALVFIGHDSGPMHVAAAVNVPCVCMFGNYNKPRRWHPYGKRHRIIHNMKGVKEITHQEVSCAVEEVIQINQTKRREADLALT